MRQSGIHTKGIWTEGVVSGAGEIIWKRAVAAIADAGALVGEFYLLIIPTFVFALLLIGSSLLAWRESSPRRV